MSTKPATFVAGFLILFVFYSVISYSTAWPSRPIDQ